MPNHMAFLNGSDSLPASPMLAAGAFALLDAKTHQMANASRGPNARQTRLAIHLAETEHRLQRDTATHNYTLQRGLQDSQHQHERVMQQERLAGEGAGRAHSFSMATLASSDAREDREHAWRMQGAPRSEIEGTFEQKAAHEQTLQHIKGQQNFELEKMKTSAASRTARGQQKVDQQNVHGQLRMARDRTNLERESANLPREHEHLLSLEG